MASTRIDWSDAVWNPVTGCTPISEGCQRCYAKRMAARLHGRHGYPDGDPFSVTLRQERLDLPLKWRRPQRIFVNSMGDLFHESVPFEFIERMFVCVEEEASQHTYLILTKRPERMRDFIAWYAARCSDESVGLQWEPATNVWLGVSAETQERANERIPALLDTPAAVRFVSLEPLLGPVDLRPWRGLDWVIVGAETGPGARPFDPAWIRRIIDACRDAQVPMFLKANLRWSEEIQELPAGGPGPIRKGGGAGECTLTT